MAIRQLEAVNSSRNLYPPISGLPQALVEIAVRILFVATSIWVASVTIPLSFQAVLLPLSGVSLTFLSGFFYRDSRPVRPIQFQPPPILLHRKVEEDSGSELSFEEPQEDPLLNWLLPPRSESDYDLDLPSD